MPERSAMTAMWLGPVPSEARSAFQRARESGMSPTRALAIGHIGSFKEGWAFRRTIAAAVGCALRTVGRAIRQAKELGLLGTARAKKDEIPPGCSKPMTCGWSHRWVIGWGKAGAAVDDAVHAARARWLVKHAAPVRAAGARDETLLRPARQPHAKPTPNQARKWTAAELDQELERLERLKKPPPA